MKKNRWFRMPWTASARSLAMGAAVGLSLGLVPLVAQAANVLFVGGAATASAGDDGAAVNYLTGTLKHSVKYKTGADAQSADAASVDLIVISSTVDSTTVAGKFGIANKPVLSWETDTFQTADLAISDPDALGLAEVGRTVRILNPNHPIAAGMSGAVTIANSDINLPFINTKNDSRGISIGSVAIAGFPGPDVTINPGGTGLRIGCGDGCDDRFSGRIDEVAIWTRPLSYRVDATKKLTGGDVFKVHSSGGVSAASDGLLGYWSFDDVNVADSARDDSGNGHPATIADGPIKVSTDKAPSVGGAASLEIDKLTPFVVNVEGMVRPAGPFTYSLWFKPSADAFGDTMDTGDDRTDLLYGLESGRPHLTANRHGYPIGLYVTGDDSSGESAEYAMEAESTSLASGQWHHMLVTFDGTNHAVFLDGVLESNGGLLDPRRMASIVAVDKGHLLNDGSEAAARRATFPISDTGFSSLNANGLKLFSSTVNWLLNVSSSVAGDFNGNGVLDAGDIDSLSAQVRTGSNPASFDLTGDTLVNEADREFWVVNLSKTYFGDANLDGLFNSTDFVTVFQAGQYEDATAGNSGWATGDWNGDADFNSSDFVTAFQAGGYEKGPRAAVSAVPEPSSLLLVLGSLPLLRRFRRR